MSVCVCHVIRKLIALASQDRVNRQRQARTWSLKAYLNMSISIKNLRGNTEESALTAHTSALHMLQTLLLSVVAEVQETDGGGAANQHVRIIITLSEALIKALTLCPRNNG